MHTVIYGPPGTGKTEIAKMSRIVDFTIDSLRVPRFNFDLCVLIDHYQIILCVE